MQNNEQKNNKEKEPNTKIIINLLTNTWTLNIANALDPLNNILLLSTRKSGY